MHSAAVEVAAGHSILFADLPTNGLDSATALGLVRATKRSSVLGGRARATTPRVRPRVMCTRGPGAVKTSAVWSVVQPSPEIFEQFDNLMLLTRLAPLPPLLCAV
jgi:hypothetical protein